MFTFVLSLAELNDDDKILHIHDHYYQEMLKVAHFILKDASKTLDEEDAVQNAFCRLQEYSHNIPSLNHEKQLRSYVLITVKREAYKLLENAVYYEDIGEYSNTLISDEDFVQTINRVDEYQRVVDAIAQLDDRYSIPLYMRWVEELSVKKIARRLDIPVKTVYTNFERGKYLLAKALGRELD